MKAKFIDFLVKNKAYRQFMYDLAYCDEGCYGWDVYSYEVPAEDWVAAAFWWDESREGHNYWQAIDSQWMTYFKIKS